MALLQPSGDVGIGSWPARRARMAPGRTALVQGDLELTFAELADRTSRLAGALRELGIRAGDRVAFLGVNDIATFECLFAAGQLGAVLVPLNTRLTAAEIAYMLGDCGAHVLVVGHGVDDLVAAALGLLDQGGGAPGHVLSLAPVPGVTSLDLEDATTATAPLDIAADVGLDQPAIVLYTSGTTGRPKGAVLTHGNLTWNTINQLAHVDVLGSDRALCFSPLFHVVGLGQVTLPTLFKGGSVEVLPGFDPAVVLATVSAHAITGFSGVPTMLQLMAEHPSFDAADLTSLRLISYGGSPVPERVARAWLDRGVTLVQGYGMTEASPGVLMALPEGAAEHPVSVGVPHFFTDLAVLGADGSAESLVHGGPDGELLVRGPNVFDGYWGRPKDSRQTVVEDRWFRTGDVVRKDVDGWSHVVDRVKDMIISGGENIYPAEVEAVLTAVPGVRDAAVVGEPDPRWGEVGVAFVELSEGAAVTADELRTALRAALAKYKVPRSFVFVDALPRNATGKVRRLELRERALERPHDRHHQEVS